MQNKIRGYIYKITNLQNGFCYIGKTLYKNLDRRFQQHIHYAFEIQGGSKTSLHEAMRQYGKENFIIERVDEIHAPQFLEDAEKYYIKHFHSWIKDPECKGYNQSKGGEGTHYKDNEFNDELAERIIAIYNTVKNQTEVARQLEIDIKTVHNYLIINGIKTDNAKNVAIRETGKKVAIYNNDKIIAIYPSLGEAARHFKEKEQASHISEVCYGKRKHIKGYTAKFTDEPLFNENYILPTLENSENMKSSNRKKSVAMLDINTGKILRVFESGCAAGRYFEMPKPASATTCIKKTIDRDGTWRGYKWAYV